jgi:hypothetical protein
LILLNDDNAADFHLEIGGVLFSELILIKKAKETGFCS